MTHKSLSVQTHVGIGVLAVLALLFVAGKAGADGKAGVPRRQGYRLVAA